ncbi:MAG: GNAT family N-acetyltransferase [Acidobacteriota bacterium]|nr:GNAT family N-acetyltransferase [Acidobacteriota bacterium]
MKDVTTESDAAGLLVLRPWRVEDARRLRAAIDESLDSLKRWMSWGRDEPTPLAVLEERLRADAEAFAAGRRWRYAMLLGHGGPLAGGAGLHPRVGPRALEVSYWVRAVCRRRGIAAAAASALARHAFLAHGVGHVDICVDIGNDASAAVALSLGCEPRGTITREHSDGSPRPMLVYRLESLDALRAPVGWRVEIIRGGSEPSV